MAAPELTGWELLPNAHDAVNITWSRDINGTLENEDYFYLLQYRRVGENMTEGSLDFTMQHWQIVSNLTLGVWYEFQVTLMKNGQEFPSDWKSLVLYDPLGLNDLVLKFYQTPWFFAMIIAIFVLLLIFIIVCVLKCERGSKYYVKDDCLSNDDEDEKTELADRSHVTQ
ncbi:neurofascin-like isoform X1 [Argonauta hians]